MKRRNFVQKGILLTGATIIAPSLIAQTSHEKKRKIKQLTILHTNDTHSTIEPFPANHSKFPGKGGVVNRFNLIQKIRSEEENVLLLDAGDIFQGTPYFNMFGGVIEMKVMSKMGYDAATMGNHDFDGGMDGFLKAKEYADFPFLCSNYDFSATILKNQTQDSIIKEIGGLKVGIFGIGVELKGLVPDDKFGETVYLDPITSANRVALELKKKGCDLIICLSHLGYQYESDKISDLKLAAATKNIHLIIGGHTHTFLEKPTEVKNSDGQIVLVNQVGWGGIHLGRIDFDIEKKRFNRKQVVEIQ
ncbi:MAG: metallophosphatase [Crocinitomicaceae bacterium]|nr:metallophosphatase [Crocinitomicaceae bacterium]MDP5099159.1 metallophosphatase [Crocinitomicaceae bacterium]